MDYFQILPLFALTAYFCYLTYYYAAPMFCLKILLFYAHIRYRGIDIRFTEGKISVKMPGEEKTIDRPIETDPASRFFAMNVRAEFREMLGGLKNRNAAEGKACELPSDEGMRNSGRQRIEEDHN